MDWFVTDRWETPPHLAAHYSERLMILPDGYVCYSPPSDAPDVGPPPAVRRGHVTFGCFNNLAKITPAVLDAWSRVLRRTPAARIVLKTQAFADAEVRARALAEFSARGVSRDRVELRGGSSHRAFLSQYGDVDMVLDPFPYSGGLTTCEALWMGVPVLTLPGETFASRHSASHVSNVGLADWIAADVDAYVDQAVRRAGDVEALAALRSELRARVKASPLCDAPRFGRSLGAALRRAWRDWCAQAAA
jgi:predicted O-linked N-acetylglucosamine transferase (SPINDLY family)